MEKRRRTREDRRRTARACDRCRRLKERCEGGFPCLRCIHLGRHCEFKRLPQFPQDEQSDCLPPIAESPSIPIPEVNIPELLERVSYMENILKHKFEGIALDVDSLRRMSRALDQHDQNSDHPATPLPAEEDPIEDEVCTIDPVEDTTTHYSGEFSYWNFSMRVKRHIEDRMHPQSTLKVSNYARAEQLQYGVNRIAAAISCCPPRHVADFLVNVFFKHAQTYYFYVDRGWLTEKLHILYDDPGKFSKKSVAVVSIILTVFAIATQYAYLEALSQRSWSTNTESSEDALGTMFYQQAIQFLPEIIEASSLESVQTCLLFAVYALSVDASGLGYIYITLTNRLGMQNGMHRKYTGTGLSAAMIETRNRIWWTAYTLERKVSIFHGRPLSTHSSDVDAHLPTHNEATQGPNTQSTLPYTLASVLLTKRLEEISHDLFLYRTCGKGERLSVLSRLIARKKDLDSWWQTLPERVHSDIPHDDCDYRALAQLRLEYCLVKMFIGRPLLLNRASSRSPASPGASETRSPGSTSITTSENGSSNYTIYRQELVEYCIGAAQEALSLCRDVRDNGPGLARSSYIEYSSCRASLLVLIAQSIEKQSALFRTQLRDGLDMIKEMAAAGDSARSEVALLESLERALARLLHTTDKHEGRSTGSDYENFKNWESAWKSSTMPPLPEQMVTPSTRTLDDLMNSNDIPSTDMPDYGQWDHINSISHRRWCAIIR
ncbi:transcription factor domain-containing protein [Aspergillus stella-maris]|uniref:transcription factor domain-containing protein n=1 Tax=Aspergillus stella-maris TaxID=1810926 RepID=UPI003CCCA87D